jgi:hypothetical protein
VIKQALARIAEKHEMPVETYYEEEKWIDKMFTSDFYIPHVRLVMEVNGVRAFYPYTRKVFNYSRFKGSMLRGSRIPGVPEHPRYNVFNLNVHTIEGLLHEPGKLDSFMERTITSFQ